MDLNHNDSDPSELVQDVFVAILTLVIGTSLSANLPALIVLLCAVAALYVILRVFRRKKKGPSS